MFLRSLTTEAMGIWRVAGAFTVALRQSECGSKTCGMHVSQPVPIGVCYQQAVDSTSIVFSLCKLLYFFYILS